MSPVFSSSSKFPFESKKDEREDKREKNWCRVEERLEFPEVDFLVYLLIISDFRKENSAPKIFRNHDKVIFLEDQ